MEENRIVCSSGADQDVLVADRALCFCAGPEAPRRCSNTPETTSKHKTHALAHPLPLSSSLSRQSHPTRSNPSAATTAHQSSSCHCEPAIAPASAAARLDHCPRPHLTSPHLILAALLPSPRPRCLLSPLQSYQAASLGLSDSPSLFSLSCCRRCCCDIPALSFLSHLSKTSSAAVTSKTPNLTFSHNVRPSTAIELCSARRSVQVHDTRLLSRSLQLRVRRKVSERSSSRPVRDATSHHAARHSFSTAC